MIDRDFASFTCFSHPQDEVVRCVMSVLKDEHANLSLLNTSIDEAEFELPKQFYNPPSFETLIWEPKSNLGTCIFVSNLKDGWRSLVNISTKQHSLTCVNIRVSSKQDQWPIAEFDYRQRGRKARLVRAMKEEPRWQFFERGQPLPFEQTDSYVTPRIRDRFHHETLLGYVLTLGWDLTLSDTWCPARTSNRIQWTKNEV